MRALRFLLLAGLAACSSDTNPRMGPGPGPGPGPGGASPTEIQDCKEACNQLKFFDCNDAVDHATCFAGCDAASSNSIEVFSACVRNDICDASCSLNIQPSAGGEPIPNGSGCVDLCGQFLAEGCAPGISVAECGEVCRTDAAVVDYCLGRRSGCTLPAECVEQVSAPDPADDCRAGCEQLGFFDCITPTDVAACSTACGSAAPATLDQFVSCTSAGICQDDSCFRILGGSASADVPGCQMACDNLQFFDCIDAVTLSECRNRCTTASAAAVDSFKACTQGLCSDDSCYRAFAAAM
ncbi:MAG: hypothetical protein AAGF12_11230 [Myxococcota bacterium]